MLIVEDGSGLSTAESYISVADADTYHTERGNALWTGADAVKEALLRKATTYLDNTYRGRWKGFRRFQLQSLAWPRNEVIDEDGFPVDFESLPLQLVQATAEAALRELVDAGALEPDLERGGAIRSKREVIGPIEEETHYQTSASARTTFTIIDGLLRELTTSKNLVEIVRA